MEDSYQQHFRRPRPAPSHHHHHHQYSNRQFPNPHMDPYFRPPLGGVSPPGFHTGPPPPDFPPGGPHPGRPGGPHPSPHMFPSWTNTSFGGPSPPQPRPPAPHPPTHMNFAPPGDRWNMPPPPFVGSGQAPEPRPMSFPNPPPSVFDLNHRTKSREAPPIFHGSHFGGQHPLPNGAKSSYMDHLKGEWSRGMALQGSGGGDKFPFQNGLVPFHPEGNQVLSDLAIHQQGKVKRMKTTPQSTPKRRAPKRPLVETNKEVRVKNSTHLSVACHNLLAQDLIETNMHLYTHCTPEQLKWDYRKDILLNDLTQSSADILCLQEVQGDHYHRWYQPQLTKHGYTGLFKRRTGSKSDGCAMFYREAKLKLLGWKALEFQRQVNVLNRDNVALLAKFAVVQNGVVRDDAVFCAANTHLLFNPKAGEVKLAQISYLLAELHKMATKPGSCDLFPVLLCGDFNSTPNSHMVKFLLDSNLDYSNLSALVIAGYYEGGARKRVIPAPLLPKEMNIGPDCTYRQQEDVVVIEDGADQKGSLKKTAKQTVEVTQHSEFTSNLEIGSESKPSRTIRSIRGAKGKGTMYSGVNISDFPSLLGSTAKRGRGEDLSGGSSIDGSVLGDGEGEREMSGRSSGHGCQSRASNDSAGDSLESSVNSVSKTSVTKTSVRTDGSSKCQGSKDNAVVQNSVLAHPFKLISAYPISKTQPSTVTTYHQCAFETVDYIFFSPISCGSRKNLTGFNLLKRKVLPSTHTLLDLGPQPHQFLSSDHLLLQATFQFSW